MIPGVNAEYGDKLITLSTCEYSQNDGRLLVVAKKDGGLIQMKKKFLFPFLCFILLLLIGIGLMLYPLISNWYGERVRSTVEVQYNEAIAKLEDESIREAFRAAQEYNESLYSVQLDPAAAVDEYDSLLNLRERYHGLCGDSCD